MSSKFPFTTYHELNLDWILKKVETLSVNAEADANTIATYEERLQTAETQAQNAETSAANAQSAATAAASLAENALTTANSAQSSADASGALASQAAEKADAAQSAAESAQQAAEAAQATAANFDARITSAESQATQALNMAQGFDEQARAAITTANNAANVATEAQATANTTALELARQRTTLVTIGSQQTAAINSAGASQVTAIYNAGQAVLDSIPADYTNGVELVKDYTLGLYPQVEADYAPILSFDNGADNIPVKELKVNIIPYQSGTGGPSPSNIRPISGWTGAKINGTGANIWNEVWERGLYTITGAKGGSESYIRSTNRISCVPNTTYYIVKPNGAFYICEYDKNEQFINRTSFSYSQNAFTTAVNTRYVTFCIGGNAVPITTYDNDISINHPSSDISYHAYDGNQISIAFPAEAGTVYGGTIDVTGGLLTVTDGYIESYNGETLPGKWISDRDVYTQGGTPSTGAQVVYELSTPSTYQLSPLQFKTLLGSNNIWADVGNTSVTYRADLSMYITENSIANYAKFASMIAGVETGLTASKTYNTGDYFIVGQKLYKALTNIASGATFTLGTNCEETTVGAELVLAQ